MAIFFTSDLHFHHQNILKFSPTFRSRFKDVEDMNEKLIKYWNDTIKPDDVVYNLGDVSFSRKFNEIKKLLNRLNGKHYLILGNHDQLIDKNQEELLKSFKADGNKMLEAIYDYKKIEVERKKIILFHYPILEWEQCHREAIHLYGHIHNRIADLKGKAINVGIDLHHKILSFEDILDLTQKLPVIEHHNVQLKNHQYQEISNDETKQILIKEHYKKLNK